MVYIYMIDVVHPSALGAIKFEPWIRRSPKKGLQVSREIHVFCTNRSSTCLVQLVGCFLKWWYLTTRVFLLKMIILGCFGGSTILGNPQFDLSITDQFQRNSHHLCSQFLRMQFCMLGIGGENYANDLGFISSDRDTEESKGWRECKATQGMSLLCLV